MRRCTRSSNRQAMTSGGALLSRTSPAYYTRYALRMCVEASGLRVWCIYSVPYPALCRLTRDYHTIGDTLEVVKFVCRELWMHLFGKPITQLQTNRRVRVWHQTPHTSSARPLMSLLACLVLPGCVRAP